MRVHARSLWEAVRSVGETMRSRARSRIWLMLLAALAAGGAAAHDADIGTLRQWDLPAYTLIAQDGYAVKPVVGRLADTERALSKLLATPVKNTTVPTIV